MDDIAKKVCNFNIRNGFMKKIEVKEIIDGEGFIKIRPTYLPKNWSESIINQILWGERKEFYS